MVSLPSSVACIVWLSPSDLVLILHCFTPDRRCFGKGLDNTCPIGPVLVRPSVINGDKLNFKGVLSGETVQESNTS